MRLAVVLTIFLVIILKCQPSHCQPFSSKNLKHMIGSQAKQTNDANDYYYVEESDDESQQPLNEVDADQDQNKNHSAHNQENGHEDKVENVQLIRPTIPPVQNITVQFEKPQEVIEPTKDEENDDAEEEEEEEEEDEEDSVEDDDGDAEVDADDGEHKDGADDNEEEEELINDEDLLNFQRNSFWKNLYDLL